MTKKYTTRIYCEVPMKAAYESCENVKHVEKCGRL